MTPSFRWLPVALALATAGTAGCDAATFTSVNNALKSTTEVADTAGALTAPAAAVAAGLATMALVQAVSRDVGAYRVTATGGASGQSIDVVDAATGVDLHAVYGYTRAADGVVTATVTSLTGTVQGYTADVAGGFTFSPSSSFTGSLKGSLASASTRFALDDLALAATYPFPSRAVELGRCQLTETRDGEVKSALDATLALDAAGSVKVSGDLTRDGVTTPVTDFGSL